MGDPIGREPADARGCWSDHRVPALGDTSLRGAPFDAAGGGHQVITTASARASPGLRQLLEELLCERIACPLSPRELLLGLPQPASIQIHGAEVE